MSQFVSNHVAFQCWIVWAACCCCLVAKSCLTFSFMTPWIIAHQVPLSLEFPRQEYWSVLPFLSPGDLPNSGIKLTSAALAEDSLPQSHQASPWSFYILWILTPNRPNGSYLLQIFSLIYYVVFHFIYGFFFCVKIFN